MVHLWHPSTLECGASQWVGPFTWSKNKSINYICDMHMQTSSTWSRAIYIRDFVQHVDVTWDKPFLNYWTIYVIVKTSFYSTCMQHGILIIECFLDIVGYHHSISCNWNTTCIYINHLHWQVWCGMDIYTTWRRWSHLIKLGRHWEQF
jgi:hypothetical protein